MANFVFNIGKGRVAEAAAVSAGQFRLLVLKASATDATNTDFGTVQNLLANAGNTEADFTNYARATLSGVTVTVDNATDSVSVDANDVVFTSAGGALNNTTTDVVIYREGGGTDATRIPVVQLDAVFTTDGNDVTLQFNANGFFGAS